MGEPATLPRGGDVLVVRPCAGAEASLARTLASSRALGGDVPFRLVFAVATEDDDALPIARAACATLCGEGVDASVTVTRAAGVNQKSSQLARAIEAHANGCDVVVSVDSDVDCEGLSLAALVAPLRADPSLAALWVPPVEDGGETAGDRASDALLSGSLHAFPLLAGIDPGGLVGKVVALRADALARVGGFGALERHLGEDMELARRLRALGLRVAASPGVAVSRVRGRGADAVVDRYARWITVIRAQRPALLASYPALFFATPLVLLACAASLALPGATRASLAGLAAACVCVVAARVAVAMAARRASGQGVPVGRALVDAALADALLARAFARAMARREVRWRGRALAIDRGGVLREA